MPHDSSRRDFLKQTGTVAAGAAATMWARPAWAGAAGANEKVVLGVIGPGGQGTKLLRSVVQLGTQSRSVPHVIEAMRMIKEGAIGEVLVSKAWNSQRRRDIGRRQPEPPPGYLDYDTWVGPAPFQPYQSNLLHSVWRWWHN